LSDASGTRSWRQRFWVNDTFFVPGGPVFLYIEGEGTGSPYSVMEGEHVELAAVHGALVISLEHRFYGASLPLNDLTLNSLVFLSSHQAIGDIARFLRGYVSPTYKITFPQTAVVTFGGSYPGALSAWTRLRLPHLVTIGVSTSSPVEASFDFVGYNAVVGKSLALETIGGSPACASAVRDAFVALDASLAAGGATATAAGKMFSSCQDLGAADANDIMWAASNYGGLIQGLVQYNDEGGGLDVRGLCAIMNSTANSAVENLASAVTQMLGGSCSDNSYSDYVVAAGNTTANPAAGGLGLRQWMWQSCSQFAYWQTCEDRDVCPLSLYMSLESNTQQCRDLFGAPFTADVSAERVATTNDLLGGAGFAGTHTIFVNGLVDPWHNLSCVDTRPEVLSVIIPTGAHCRQMSASRDTDPQDVKDARAQVAAQLAIWLANRS
jgi:serine protease 16